MEQDYRKELEAIINGMTCPKDFKCYQAGLEKLCKAKDIGLQSFLECLEEYPRDCKFSLMFGDSFFCNCPLRVYIGKNLKK